MADIVIKEPHGLEPKVAVERVRGFEDTIKKYGVRARWQGTHAELTGLGVVGEIDVRGAEVQVSLRLGRLARVAGVDPVRLEGAVRRRLRAALDA